METGTERHAELDAAEDVIWGAEPERELVIERRFAAPPALVWRVWEDPDHLRRWWGPKGFTCTALDWSFREGGDWRACIVAEKYGEVWMRGRFRAIEPGRRIVFTFRWEDGAPPGRDTLIEVLLAPEGDGTRQVFRQAPFDDVATRESHRSGWGECLDREADYAAALAEEAAR